MSHIDQTPFVSGRIIEQKDGAVVRKFTTREGFVRYSVWKPGASIGQVFLRLHEARAAAGISYNPLNKKVA